MEKPLSLKLKDLKKGINEVIINSELPIYIIEPIFKDIYRDIADLSLQTTLKQEKEYLDNSLKENNETDIVEK